MKKNKDWRWIVGTYLVGITIVLIIILLLLWPKDVRRNSFTEGSSKPEISKKIVQPDSSLNTAEEVKSKTLSVNEDSIISQIKEVPNSSKDLDTTAVVNSFAAEIPELRLLELILILGALGACLHGLTSLAEYIGNKNFQKSWVLWYLLRPFVGGILALIIYIVIRGGLLPQVKSSESFYLMAALAGLTGLFSKQALYKLSDIFDTIFQSKKEEKLRDKLISGHPVPVIKSINPTTITVNSKNQSISVTGSQFIEESIVKVGDNDCKTEFKDDKNLTAKLEDSWLKSATELEISVFNPEPGGGKSHSFKLTVA